MLLFKPAVRRMRVMISVRQKSLSRGNGCGVSDAIQSRPKSSILFSVAAVLLGGSCFFVSKFATIRVMAQAEAAVTPFVLRRDVYSYSTGDSGSVSKKFITAQKSDGTTTEFTSVGPLSQDLYLRTMSLIDGKQVELADFIEAKTTWPVSSEPESARHRARTLKPPADCLFPERLS